GRMTDLEREPILRVMPGPGDINANGHIFGGWVLSQMDIAAGIVASRRAKGPVATIAIEAMKFLAPIHLRDLISVYAEVERLGRTTARQKCRPFFIPRRRLGFSNFCFPNNRSSISTMAAAGRAFDSSIS